MRSRLRIPRNKTRIFKVMKISEVKMTKLIGEQRSVCMKNNQISALREQGEKESERDRQSG